MMHIYAVCKPVYVIICSDKHLKHQRAQRLKYYEYRALGMAQKSVYLSMIVDGMDQAKTQLPAVKRRDKSDDLKLVKQKLMGVRVS